MMVGLGPGDFVLDWHPATSPKKGTAPNFRPMSIVAKRLDASGYQWYGGRPRPRRHCAIWGPISSKNGNSPQFSALVYCGQMSPISANAELLLVIEALE